MKLSNTILGPLGAIVKGADALYWCALERCAYWVLAHPFRRIRAAQRRRGPARSDALRKAPVERYRAWISTADRN